MVASPSLHGIMTVYEDLAIRFLHLGFVWQYYGSYAALISFALLRLRPRPPFQESNQPCPIMTNDPLGLLLRLVNDSPHPFPRSTR